MKRTKTSLRNINIMKSYKGTFWGLLFILLIGFICMANTNGMETASSRASYVDSTTSRAAAPLAKFKSNAPKMFKMVNISKQQWISELPTEGQLGVPVYPGAVIVVYQRGYHDSSETRLSELILVSSDPISKVESWYSKKLKDWNHIQNYDVFLPPHKIVDVMSDKFDATHHVELEKILEKHQLDGMFLQQPDNAKTAITIMY